VSLCFKINFFKLPELAEKGLEIEKEDINEKFAGKNVIEHEVDSFTLKLKIRNILIQNLGFILGVFLMFILALYSKKIKL
jgi:hypothetical protein